MELAPQSRRVASESVIGAAKRRRDDEPAEEPQVALQDIEATEQVEWVNAMAIDVHEDGWAIAAKWEDKDAQRSLELIPGRYWKVGENTDGSPIFRQEKNPDGVNDKQLWIVFERKQHEKGWYVVDNLGEPQVKHAWFRALESESIHVPYWSKKRLQHAYVMTLHAYQWWKMNELKKALDDVQKNAHEKASSSTGADDEEGKGKGKQMKHGGWLMKASYLVKAVVDRDGEAAFEIADDYARHPVMAKLIANLDAQLRARR